MGKKAHSIIRERKAVSYWEGLKNLREGTVLQHCTERYSIHVDKPHIFSMMLQYSCYVIRAELGTFLWMTQEDRARHDPDNVIAARGGYIYICNDQITMHDKVQKYIRLILHVITNCHFPSVSFSVFFFFFSIAPNSLNYCAPDHIS